MSLSAESGLEVFQQMLKRRGPAMTAADVSQKLLMEEAIEAIEKRLELCRLSLRVVAEFVSLFDVNLPLHGAAGVSAVEKARVVLKKEEKCR